MDKTTVKIPTLCIMISAGNEDYEFQAESINLITRFVKRTLWSSHYLRNPDRAAGMYAGKYHIQEIQKRIMEWFTEGRASECRASEFQYLTDYYSLIIYQD